MYSMQKCVNFFLFSLWNRARAKKLFTCVDSERTVCEVHEFQVMSFSHYQVFFIAVVSWAVRTYKFKSKYDEEEVEKKNKCYHSGECE